MVRWVVVVTERARGWEILTNVFLACLWVRRQGLVEPFFIAQLCSRKDERR